MKPTYSTIGFYSWQAGRQADEIHVNFQDKGTVLSWQYQCIMGLKHILEVQKPSGSN